MMDFEKKEVWNELFDCYSSLLTEKQNEYYKMYYFNDFSLGEIAESLGISRNAVHDQLKKTIKVLEEYEERLHLNANKLEREKQILEYEKLYSIDLSKLKNL